MRRKGMLITIVVVLALVMSAALASAGTTEAISYGADPSISADGTYVAYVAAGSFLYGGGRIYVRNRSTGELTNISYGNDGSPANSVSSYPSISCDGRYVAFVSLASNLVPGDNNKKGDVFVHDMQTGEKVIASVNSSGYQGNNFSFSTSISCDGRYVVFSSYASNLVPGDTNGERDVFVHDRDSDEDGIFDEPGGISTERVNIASDGTQANYRSGTCSRCLSISDDGRYVAFSSFATNLVPNDTNGEDDAFIHDRIAKTTVLASVDENGSPLPPSGYYRNGGTWSPAISPDGRYVVFHWRTLSDLTGGTYLYDRLTSTSTPVGNLGGPYPWSGPYSFSADGRFLSLGNGWRVHVYDRLYGTMENVSITNDGHYIDSSGADMSRDGRYVAFVESYSSRIYVRDRGPQNASPTANAGADVTAECAGPDGAPVTLDGSASTDPDGDALTYTWTGTFGTETGVNAMVTLPLGTHTVTLTVDDGNGGTGTDEVVITVADTTPPVITIFGIGDGEAYALGLVPEAGYDVMDTCSGVASSNALLVGGDGLGLGSFTYKVTATDNAGNEGTETAAYEVIATADGLISLIHQMVLDGLIAPQMENSLVSQVQNGALKAFINHVLAQSGKKIDPAAAAILTNAANYMLGNN